MGKEVKKEGDGSDDLPFSVGPSAGSPECVGLTESGEWTSS